MAYNPHKTEILKVRVCWQRRKSYRKNTNHGSRKRSHLSDAYIQMARELGLNPKKLGSLANTKQEPWKLPLAEYIEDLYDRHFRKNRPENVVPSNRWRGITLGKNRSEKHGDQRKKRQGNRVREEVRNNEDHCSPSSRVWHLLDCLFSLAPPPRFPADTMTSCHGIGRIVSPATRGRRAL